MDRVVGLELGADHYLPKPFLCRLFVLAPGGTWAARNANPGLEVTLPL